MISVSPHESLPFASVDCILVCVSLTLLVLSSNLSSPPSTGFPKLCLKFGCGTLHLLHQLLDGVSLVSSGKTNCLKVLWLGWFTCGFDVLHSVMNKDTSMNVFLLSVCTVTLKHKHKNV